MNLRCVPGPIGSRASSASALLLSLALLATAAAAGVPAGVELPRTGETVCTDPDSGDPIACAGTGQDGDVRAGVPWPSPRFTGSGDCITDALTGLVWPKAAGTSGPLDWIAALAYADTLELCGHTDWRLPNPNELASLVHAGEDGGPGYLEAQGFAGIAHDDWTSATTVDNGERAYAVDVLTGAIFDLPKDNDLYGHAWPVRGSTGPPAAVWQTGQESCSDAAGMTVECAGTGQDGELRAGAAWPAPRFTDHGDGTVTDELTGLAWTQDADRPGPPACSPGGIRTLLAAYAHVDCLNDHAFLGASDWRLPNVVELRSLMSLAGAMPALPAGHPFAGVRVDAAYWSSTTVRYIPAHDYGWVVDFTSGHVTTGYKGQAFAVWPVRGGTIVIPSDDAFLCYKAKPTKRGDAFEPPPDLALADAFETRETDVVKPKALCTPADVGGEGIGDATTHLESYQIKSSEKHEKVKGFAVANAFGSLALDTAKEDRLLVPSATGPTEPPGPLGETAVDHFKCYEAKPAKGSPKFQKLQVTVADSFDGVPRTFDVKKPKHLCLPVDKNGEGIQRPGSLRVCYKAKPAKKQPKHAKRTGVFVGNQLGTEQLDTVKEDELCVPSSAPAT